MCIFSPEIHLKGFRRCKRALGHARRHRRRRQGQVLQVDNIFLHIEYLQHMLINFQKEFT